MKRDDQVHDFLVTQWQAEQEEAEQTRRAFYPACTGPCDQNPRNCRTPEACRLPIESVESAHPWLWLAYVAAVIGTIAASAVFR